MSMDADVVSRAIAIGIGSTVLMDFWNLILKRMFGVTSLNIGLLGRWLCHMPRGIFWHDSIAVAPRMAFERPLGWIAHYSIGIVFALVFIAIMTAEWLTRPTLQPAILYGIGTVVFPLFIMQPALGLGIASSKAAKPARARIKSFATHIVFGVGLYVCARGLNLL